MQIEEVLKLVCQKNERGLYELRKMSEAQRAEERSLMRERMGDNLK